jgi:hypothetical protein
MSSEVRGLPFSCNTSEKKLPVVTCRAGAASKERLEKAYEDYSTDTKLEPARPPTKTITTYVTPHRSLGALSPCTLLIPADV